MNAVILIFSYTLFKLKQLKKLANQIRKKSKSLTFATQYLKKPRKTKKVAEAISRYDLLSL